MLRSASFLVIVVTILIITDKKADAILDIHLPDGSVKVIAGVVKDSVHDIVNHADKISDNLIGKTVEISGNLLNKTVPLVNEGYRTLDSLTTKVTNSADKNVEEVGKSLTNFTNSMVKVVEISGSTAINVTSEIAHAFKNGKYNITIDAIGPYSVEGIRIVAIAGCVTICFSVICVQLRHIIILLIKGSLDSRPKNDKKKRRNKNKKDLSEDCNKESQMKDDVNSLCMDKSCDVLLATDFTTISMPELEDKEQAQSLPNTVPMTIGRLHSVGSLVNIFNKTASK